MPLQNPVHVAEFVRLCVSQPYPLPGIDLISMLSKAINSRTSSTICRDIKRCLSEECSRHWEESVSLNNQYRNRKPSAISVEISAYALCAYVCNGDIGGARSIARWLNGQRNSKGAFVSTQVRKKYLRNNVVRLILV